MALPIRPNSDGPSSEASLPDLGALPDLPDLAPTPVKKQVKQPAQASSAPKEELPDGWYIDPKTKKKIKRLPGVSAGVIKQGNKIAKAGGLDLTQLRRSMAEEPDFDMDNLNGSAEMFLAHMRVPPDKEEQRKLREERDRRQQQFDQQAERDAREQEIRDREEFTDD